MTTNGKPLRMGAGGAGVDGLEFDNSNPATIPRQPLDEKRIGQIFAAGSLAKSALSLAEVGAGIVPMNFPIGDACSCRRGRDCSAVGKHPILKGGAGIASRDPDVIAGWWRQWPRANIGVACGATSGVVVLDVDERHGGFASLDELQRTKLGPLPATSLVSTGGGGLHAYFQMPAGGRPIKNSAGRLGPGIDVKSDGGTAIAPPSLHRSGRRYEWMALGPIRPLPPAWIEALASASPPPVVAGPMQPQQNLAPREARYLDAAVNRDLEMLARTQPGGRNPQLNMTAFRFGQWIAGGYVNEDWARQVLTITAEAIGLDDFEIEATINSGLEAGKRHPRTIPPATRTCRRGAS
jgi:hypothetical protein